MQDRRNSIANPLELRLSCTNPSNCFKMPWIYVIVLVMVRSQCWITVNISRNKFQCNFVQQSAFGTVVPRVILEWNAFIYSQQKILTLKLIFKWVAMLFNKYPFQKHFYVLSQEHWGRDKMDAISQTTFWSAFSWMKMFEFWTTFHWSYRVSARLLWFQVPLSWNMEIFSLLT